MQTSRAQRSHPSLEAHHPALHFSLHAGKRYSMLRGYCGEDMFKPIQAARSAGKFTSLDALAKRLQEAAPELDWLAPRALAVKIGDIDRGD